jgi:hypothetical protein
MTNMLAGSTTTLLTMVHCLLRHFDPRSARISTSDIWSADVFGWTCHSSMGMVHWQYNGILHSKFGYVERAKVQLT